MRLLGIFRREILAFLDALASALPGRAGQFLRHGYYSLRLGRLGRMGARGTMAPGIQFFEPENIFIGDDFNTLRGCVFAAPGGGRIELGNNVSFASNVVVDAGCEGVIRIGDNSGVAHNCVLRSSPHNYSDPSVPFKSQGHKPGSILIDEDVWVAANCVLLPGTHIEKGCVVASGSIVGGLVKAYSIIAGNPARVIGRRGG
ncbi:MAG TPA: acyltransferase [Elusimicrobiota bacterium]|jgi:galactoside O-acetyltransferase|nr:acyltransferase [Elusimicrobiota bacterium]